MSLIPSTGSHGCKVNVCDEACAYISVPMGMLGRVWAPERRWGYRVERGGGGYGLERGGGGLRAGERKRRGYRVERGEGYRMEREGGGVNYSI